jgi:ATP-dependent phosphofructokinase / diphosphate-dependent phosphofructokinase
MRVAILTGGGDCPGLNAVIRAVVRRGITNYNYGMLGIKRGWAGLISGDVFPLTSHAVSGILPKGGTILGTSRTNPFQSPTEVVENLAAIKSTVEKFGIDAIVAVGGDDTLGVAHRLFNEYGIKCVGVPKTIDNDLKGTEFTFGFNTAVAIATEAIDRLHSTAESHNRIMVIEVMGRHTGWIAIYSGIAGGADLILIPEVPYDIKEVCKLIRHRHARGKDFSIVVVSEGVKPPCGSEFITQDDKLDAFGHVRLGGVSHIIAAEIEKQTGFETRVTVLGHVQRGGSPISFDRVLATRFGAKAVELIADGQYDHMVALNCGEIIAVPMENALEGLKEVDKDIYDVAKTFFG